MQLATMIPDADGITDIHSQTTYGSLCGLMAPYLAHEFFAAALADPDAPCNRSTYERVVMLISGGFDDQ